jgi:uncharacterized protein (TIGR00369 family)
MTDEIYDDDHCFVCGSDNASGLGLSPEAEDGSALIRWAPPKVYQGYSDVLHGGLVSTLCDEAMAYAVKSLVGDAVTARMEVRFSRPVATGVPLEVRAEVTDRRRRTVAAEARLVQEGEVRAFASGTFVSVGDGA